MQNFQDTFETGMQSFICAFSICLTVPLRAHNRKYYGSYLSNQLKIKVLFR